MKKTQRKDAFRNIKKRIVSYLSICLVVMLGLGGLFTTSYMCAGLDKKAAEYYDAHNFKNYDFASSYGISEANLEKIKADDRVTDAEGVIQADGSVSFRGQKRNATILSLTEKVSVPDVTEGKLPSEKDECMIGEDFAEMEGLKVGDKLSISLTGLSNLSDQTSGSMDMDIDADLEAAENEDAETENSNGSPLCSKEFTVTGLMHHPDFLRRMSTNTVVLPFSAFNTEVTEGLYTHAFVRIEQPEKTSMFKDEYFDKTEDTRLSLEELASELEEDRTQEVRDKANAYIDEEWAKAEARLEDAQAEIDSGEEELNAELAAGRKKLNDAEQELARETAKYEKLFRDGDKTIAEKEKELKEGKKQLAEKKQELADAKSEVEKGRKKLAEKEKELRAAKKKLAQGKAVVKTLKKLLGGDEEIKETYKLAKKIKNKVAEIDKLIEDGEDEQKTEKKIKALGALLLDNKESIKTIFDFAADPATPIALEELKKYTKIDLSEQIDTINEYGYDQFLEDAENMKETGDEEFYENMRKPLTSAIDSIITLIETLWKLEAELAKNERKIKDGEHKIASAKIELKGYEEAITKGEKTIAAYDKQIKEGEQLLKQKKKELKEGKAKFAAEKAKNERKIAAGWSDYFAQKAGYETKLEEATALLAENREKAEEKLAEARAEADSIEPCDCVVLDRKSNAGYLDIKSNLDATSVMGVVFGILFAVITAIVCFSTLVIIIDEHKTMVGTAKAFGFFRREVLGKYLVFGVSSAVVGSILAIITGVLLSGFVQKQFTESGIYPIGTAKSIITPVPTVLFSLLIIAVTIAATVIACSGILKSPASMLMKGAVLRKEKKKKPKQKTASKSGSLYSRLIIRNMIQDKARVVVTVAIIGFSCMLIGMGISLKFAYSGMMDRQESVVNRFDVRMDMNDDVTDEDEAELVSVLEKNGTGFLPATVESTLYRWSNRLDGVNVICADPEKVGDFYGIVDPETGEDAVIPDNGILIQKRMQESYGMNDGDRLPVLDSSLREHEAEIKGTFVNYVGRTIVISPASYKSIFGEANDVNCYYVRLNGADIEKMEKELLAVSDNISFETNDEFRIQFDAGTRLYNVIVLVTTGIAILISFMILTNLANIYLNRKKTELTIMRVNGFKIKEAKGYLSKESILTTAAGLALGVIAGMVLTPLAIQYIQQPDLEFVKSFQPVAWAAAVGLEALFSLVINKLVYGKVKDLNLRDIA